MTAKRVMPFRGHPHDDRLSPIPVPSTTLSSFRKPTCFPALWEELNDPDTPAPVRAWLAQAPPWLQVQPLHCAPDPKLDYLDEGEREALTN